MVCLHLYISYTFITIQIIAETFNNCNRYNTVKTEYLLVGFDIQLDRHIADESLSVEMFLFLIFGLCTQHAQVEFELHLNRDQCITICMVMYAYAYSQVLYYISLVHHIFQHLFFRWLCYTYINILHTQLLVFSWLLYSYMQWLMLMLVLLALHQERNTMRESSSVFFPLTYVVTSQYLGLRRVKYLLQYYGYIKFDQILFFRVIEFFPLEYLHKN